MLFRLNLRLRTKQCVTSVNHDAIRIEGLTLAPDEAPMAQTSSPARIPLWLRILYTAFLAVLVPYYWSAYGPQNFLYFCDVALLLTLVAVWTGRSLPASMAAIGIVAPQLLWLVDFAFRSATGGHIVDLTEYMFDSGIPLFVRGLSLFHGWLPLLLLWLVWKLGYDRRALVGQTIATWAVLGLTYLCVSDPQHPAGNVNKIFGFVAEGEVQQSMPPLAWLAVLMAAYPILILIPTHFVFRWLMPATACPSPSADLPSTPQLEPANC